MMYVFLLCWGRKNVAEKRGVFYFFFNVLLCKDLWIMVYIFLLTLIIYNALKKWALNSM